jgi:hypothetical protein
VRGATSLWLVAIVSVTTTVVSCGVLQPPEDLDRDARAFMGLVARNHLDSAFPLLQVEGDQDTVRMRLQQGRDFVSPYALDSAKLVGWNVVTMGDTRGTLTYEAQAGTQWALLSVDLVRSGASSRVTGFRWQPMAARLADLNAFSLGGRSVAHYLYLILALASVVACLGGALFAGVRRMGILWVLFCLLGVGKATINWTTGQQAFNPVNIQVFGAGYVRPGMVGPWFVSWSLPLGTILMFLKWRARRATTPGTEPPIAV